MATTKYKGKSPTLQKVLPPILGRLVSRLKHPVVVAYNNSETVIAPNGYSNPLRKRDLDFNKIPAGVKFVPLNKNN